MHQLKGSPRHIVKCRRRKGRVEFVACLYKLAKHLERERAYEYVCVCSYIKKISLKGNIRNG